jgi:hypothetical protein
VIKRRELERLRHLAMRQYEVQNGINKSHVKFPQHIEIQSPTFEIDDLRKLIKTTTKDLVSANHFRPPGGVGTSTPGLIQNIVYRVFRRYIFKSPFSF